ncbi:MAG: hypothetical protein JST93_07025 [Acidobacteria bacterium]|nr:hypothetical protein [Acidobacteriota bacterium]
MPVRLSILWCWISLALMAQSPEAVRLLGTIQAVASDGLSLVTDQKQIIAVGNEGKAQVRKVAPGARDMAQAQDVQWTDLAAGDRVLVRGYRLKDIVLAESVVLMSAREIAKRNDDLRREWMSRGVAGLVDKVNPNGEITVLVRGEQGMKPITVDASGATFLRYARDSVRFADARASVIADVKKGDQLRALGDRAADSSRLKAEKVLFGTFRSVAGAITSLDEDKGTMALKDQVTGKQVVVKTKPESQIKRMPEMGAGGPGPGGFRGQGGPGGPGGAGMMRPGGGAPDINALLERMPASQLKDLKVGETIIASAAVGEQPGDLTAFLILGNAGGLLARLASAAENTQRGPGAGQSMGMTGGLGGLDSMMGMPGMQ